MIFPRLITLPFSSLLPTPPPHLPMLSTEQGVQDSVRAVVCSHLHTCHGGGEAEEGAGSLPAEPGG